MTTTIILTVAGSLIWQVPEDVTILLLVEVWGAGAGGGGTGGSGGNYSSSSNIVVTPLLNINYTIGAGNINGRISIQPGGDTWFNAISLQDAQNKGPTISVAAKGGSSPKSFPASTGVGLVTYAGGNVGNGMGGGGSATKFGNGGDSDDQGNGGSAPGGGCGGVYPEGWGQPNVEGSGGGATIGHGGGRYKHSSGYAGGGSSPGGGGAYFNSPGGNGQIRITY